MQTVRNPNDARARIVRRVRMNRRVRVRVRMGMGRARASGGIIRLAYYDATKARTLICMALCTCGDTLATVTPPLPPPDPQ